ncbi:hypothetical protein AJ78_04878 [Emergomyces pasteurianus Ep9510]|uniref:Uncharacterized protein n=1 Tax=Emergomyces pasteurianus Ep9510 TaxID=1447872 RepID=A0A1J9PFS1_9EURO|nr:hypothetical protein AJ78_04878 [Emergomyces pasteurianus Ep9510]
MGMITALCQMALLGLASAQIDKLPLMKTVRDLHPKFDPVLPAPQKYSFTKWSADEVHRGIPPDGAWSESLYDTESDYYCKDDFTIYNVTFVDCPEPWLVGHCAKGAQTKEATFDILGRLPSSARGVISDLLHVKMRPGRSVRYNVGHSVIFGGASSSTEGLKMMLSAIRLDLPDASDNEFAEAVAADTCVADEQAAADLKQGRYRGALDGAMSVAAYLKLVKTPPLDASCMNNQLKYLSPYLDARWDTPGQCPNKVAPRLVQHKPFFFEDGIDVLDADPVPAADAEVIQWDKSDGYPQHCLEMSQTPRESDNETLWCNIDRLNVYNLTYSDCPDQEPWTVCHCSDSQQSVDAMVTKFGRLPAGLRSYVRHLLVVSHEYIDWSTSVDEWNLLMSGGNAPDSSYMSAVSQIISREFVYSETWKNAVSQDLCWPEPIFGLDSPWYQVFATTGAAYLYDASGKSLLERGYDASCMKRGLQALGKYVGNEYRRTSKCHDRLPNAPIVHPVGNNLQPSNHKLVNV